MSGRQGSPRVACVGEAAVDLRAAGGAALDEARSFDARPGGGAVNTALELARLGVSSALCAAFGDDPLGRGAKARVAEAGVDVSFVCASPARTGLVFMGASRTGGQSFLSYRDPEADARALLEALPDRFGSSVVHLSGVGPTEAAVALFRGAIEAARRGGARVSLDLNARPRVFRGAIASAPSLADVLGAADIIKCALGDLRVMGVAGVDALRALARPGALIFVTDGVNPARAIGPFGELERSPIALIDVDPSGAGDAFCAGFLAEIAAEPAPSLLDRGLALRALDRAMETSSALLHRKELSELKRP